jgi:hypothetical protein
MAADLHGCRVIGAVFNIAAEWVDLYGASLANILRKLDPARAPRPRGTRGPHLTVGVCGVRGDP